MSILIFPQQGQPSCLTHMDWSTDSTYLQTNSGDFELLYCKSRMKILKEFRTNENNLYFLNVGNASICRQITNAATMRDTSWASQSCILSFNTIGVWPETIDGTDLNTCSR